MTAPRRWSRRLAGCLLVGATVLASVAPADAQGSPAGAVPASPGGVVRADPELTGLLDGVIGASPADTCLTVAIDGTPVYDHRGSDLQIPASAQKLLTAGAALEVLGPDHRFETTLVSAGEVRDGTLVGDAYLVGSGDPLLTSELDRAVRQLPASRPVTELEGFATALEEAGIERIDGRILGDESRYDQERTVPSWPARHAAENQSGPLGALLVDRGFTLDAGEAGLVRTRSAAPAADAAAALTATLRNHGIDVTGASGEGTAPQGSAVVASVTSEPLQVLVDDLLLRSDNQMAEQVTKELGVASGAAGTTADGTRAIAAWAGEADVAGAGSFVADGSGLDRGNQTTCQALAAVLAETGGRDGSLAEGLPVAGETGTLAGRFGTTEAVGVLRAKTGSLNGVTSLAGFVDLPDGEVATFTYIANGDAPVAPRRPQEFLAQVLATYRRPCPAGTPPPLVITGASGAAAVALGGVAPLAIGPATAAAALASSEAGPSALDRCSRRDEGATVVGGPA